jgi:hypothetical protein
MVRNWRVLIIPATIILVFAAGLFIYFIKQPDQVPQKPNTVQPPTDNPKFTWYIKFSVKDQKSTSYTEAASAPVAASGKRYFIGSGAVHPRYPLNAGGNPIQPIIPFGTTVYLDKPININGKDYKSLVINDTGDVYYGLWQDHPYWIDVYYGTTNYYSDKNARDAGVRLINYSWYEKWQ